MNISDVQLETPLIEKEIYKDALHQKKPITFHSCKDTYKEKSLYLQVLRLVLDEVGANHLLSYCSFLVNELVDNAIKANLKRVHFRRRELDITNPQHYKIGMEDFQTVYVTNFEEYCNEFETHNFFTTLEYSIHDDLFTIKVVNTGATTDSEAKRFAFRTELANAIDSLWDALSLKDDFPEGVGLGIITIVLMMKGLGVSPDSLKLSSDIDKNQTTVMVTFSTRSQFNE